MHQSHFHQGVCPTKSSLFERPASCGSEFQNGESLRRAIVWAFGGRNVGRANIFDAYLFAEQCNFLFELFDFTGESNTFVGTVGRPTASVGDCILGERDDVNHGSLDSARPAIGELRLGFSSRH